MKVRKQKESKQQINPHLAHLQLQISELNKLKDGLNINNQNVEVSIPDNILLETTIIKILHIESIDNILEFFNLNCDQFYYNPDLLSSLIDLLFFFKTHKAFLGLKNKIKLAAIVYFKDLIHFYKKISQLLNFLHFFEIYDRVKSLYSNINQILSDRQLEINGLLRIISLFQFENKYDPHIILPQLLYSTTERFIIDFLEIYNDSLILIYEAISTKKYKFAPETTKLLLESSYVKDKPQIKEDLLLLYTQQNMENPSSLSQYILLIEQYNCKSQRIDYKLLINQCIGLYLRYKLIDQVQGFIFQIINKEMINLELIKQILIQIPYENVNRISKLLKTFPSLFNFVANDYVKENEMKNLLKLIKLLPEFDLDANLKKDLIYFTLEQYYRYKIKECIDDHFDLVVDYAIGNESEFNIALSTVIGRWINYRKQLEFLIFKGYQKGYKLNKQNYDYVIKVYGKDFNKHFEQNDSQWINDTFGIRNLDEICIKLPKSVNVVFSSSLDQIKEFIQNYLVNSRYIGIDSEWKQTRNMFEQGRVSILQLSDGDGMNVLLIDMIKFDCSTEFINILRLLSKSTFIGFGFSSDMINFNKTIAEFFTQVHFEELQKLYIDYSQLNQCPGLSTICKEIFCKELCKYEQCSNWENRPLRKSQIHYAALDAVVCVQIFKELNSIMNNNNNF